MYNGNGDGPRIRAGETMFEEGCGADAVGAHLLGAGMPGALDPGERAAAEAHLASCPSCRDEAGELAVVPRALADLPLDAYLTDFLLTPGRMGDLALRVLERAADEDPAAGGPRVQPG
ncbi:zf-HC2 domain-containing protein [Nocardiopsis sp. CC223A]|uniref:zf-HC2 domain-containing protein n=1 Tax=Nocardiopsis sp. CC223A TaxID=3044051 RepID=UPI00278C14BC|nr:zf-HC2 domain-containing protein [Nocardiopsis sp. CC223A]